MSKSSSKKRIIIAASLFAIFLIGAIVSVVLVLAATTQNVQTNISISYIVDGVGAKVKSSYAIVPVSEDGKISRVSMTSNGNEDLNFGVSEQQSTAEMQPASGLYLDTDHQQIVFEYYFESTSDAAFSIELIDSPGKNSGTNTKEQTSNMLETFCVSNTRLDVAEYRNKITEEKLKPQALTELGQHVFIYVSAKVKNENLNAYYNGLFTWKLNKQDTITVTLNNGDTKGELKVIPSSVVADINMPCIKIPTKDGSAFAGYYVDGTKYIYLDGTGYHVANVTTSTTLEVMWYEGMTISGTTLISATEAAVDDNGVLTIPEGITVVGDGVNAVTDAASTVIIPSSVREIAANAFSNNITLTTVSIENTTQIVPYADAYDAVNNLRTIQENAFYGCNKLTSITIPSTVVSIGEYAFAECTGLTKINIPASIKTIGKNAFYDCESMLEIYLENLESWLKIDFLDEYGDTCYKHPFEEMWPDEGKYYLKGEELTDLVIPKSITEIKSYAFLSCNSLKSVTIHKNIKNIQDDAFSWCINTEKLYLEDLQSWISLDIMGSSSYGSNRNPFENSNAENINYYINGELLTYIDIPENITAISGSAFYGCDSLEMVRIHSNVTSIGNYSFNNCDNLASVVIAKDSKLTSIGNFAFQDCVSLKGFEIPHGTTSIGNYAFSDCERLSCVIIPSTVNSIGSSAFYNCRSLMQIKNLSGQTLNGYTNPGGAEILTSPDDEFTSKIEEINGKYSVLTSGLNKKLLYVLDKSITSADDIPVDVTEIGDYAFKQCKNLKNVTIPLSVTKIGKNAFEECEKLTKVVIPNGVTDVGSDAFSNCKNLTTVIIPNSITNAPMDVFDGCWSLVQIKNPSGKLLIGFSSKGYEEIITDPTQDFSTIIEKTEKYTYFKTGSEKILINILDQSISNVNDLDEDLTMIGIKAFYGCNNLINITIPDSVKTIEESAFFECESLTTVNISENSHLTIIDDSAFHKCVNIANIYIPANVESINRSAFYYCKALKNVVFADDCKLTNLGESVFYGCSSLESIKIPSGITSIEKETFRDCSNLISVMFNEGIETIKDNAFKSCYNLQSITLPNSLTSLGSYVFQLCSELKTVYSLGSITKIGASTFGNCEKLALIMIPSTVTSINYNAFSGCNNLVQIKNLSGKNLGFTPVSYAEVITDPNQDFESQIENNGKYSIFVNGNEKILLYANDKSIINADDLPSDLTAIGQNAFIDCANLLSVFIPNTVKSIGSSAFSGCINLKAISLPEGLEAINSSTFSGCTQISSLTIPSTVKIIGASAFSECTKLIVTFADNSQLTDINQSAFSNCTNLKVLHLPNGLINIANEAFFSCMRLNDLIIPNTVQTIGRNAFYNCSSLTSITIPESVTSIAGAAFYDCTALTEINYNAKRLTSALTSSNSIFSGAGSKGTGITVNIGESVEEIPAYLFYVSSSSNRPNITSVVLPSGSAWVYSTTKGTVTENEVTVDASTLATNLKDTWKTYYLIRTDN